MTDQLLVTDMVWNLNYVTTFMDLHLPAKLLPPSLLCTSDKDIRAAWFLSRIITLKTSFMPIIFESTGRKTKQRVVKLPLDRRSATARVSARHLELHAPAACCGFGSLYEMWSKIMK